MILGRPANLVLGAFTAIFNLVVLVLAALVPPIIIPAVVVAGVGIAAGAVIGLIANQPPTVSEGDKVSVVTPSGQPNYTIVATPTPPPAVVPEG